MTVEEFAERLGVSRETIRRDLTRLEAIGEVRKYHGGARLLATPAKINEEKEGPFTLRMAQNVEAKQKIAHAASRLLRPDDSLFIDTGSTTIAMAEALATNSSLIIITNSPKIASVASANLNHKIFLIGGAYAAEAGESVGPLALEQISKFRAQHAILTVGAINSSCIMDFDVQEAEIAKAMIERADNVIVLADHSKFERSAVFEVVPLLKIHTIVTDAQPSMAMARALETAGVNLIVA
ncbi:transcriptional regulator, DeoR family [Rhizobium miluonense]|uniref:Transcriptional regulator, DeoR family n=2 Tax=Rhizobium miluonense TaxID=411945 RepID=A0A1C3WCF7_9HYPH|nr:transcriptional regulator, DeoR family [Rhizobium miluonense]